MTHLDTLLAQALALVSEDKRGELADAIEEIASSTRRAALEEAARWNCLGCETGTPLEDDPVLGFIHRRPRSRSTPCQAAAIHRMLQREPPLFIECFRGSRRYSSNASEGAAAIHRMLQREPTP